MYIGSSFARDLRVFDSTRLSLCHVFVSLSSSFIQGHVYLFVRFTALNLLIVFQHPSDLEAFGMLFKTVSFILRISRAIKLNLLRFDLIC